MSHISAFDLMDEDDKFYNRSRPMEGGYSIVAHNHEDSNKEYRLGLDHGDGTFALTSNATTFHTRRSAEKFVKEHRHAQDAVSYLWDLDSNLNPLSLQKNTERTQHYELASCHDVHAHTER